MTEAVVEKPVVEAPVVEVVEQPEMTPMEVSARDQGWVSKEEWVDQGKAEDDWVSAKEFVRVGDIYKSLHQTKREMKQTQAQLDALRRHNTYIFEKAYQTARDDLKKEKRLAIREGDLEKLEEVENKIEELVETHVKEKQDLQSAPQANQPPPEFVEFVNKNPWYVQDKELRDEADALGFIYLNNGGDRDGLFTHVSKKMREKFPNKFGVKRTAPNAVASVNRTARTNSSSFELDEMETQIMNSLVSSGEMTKTEYIASLKKAKGIK